MIEDMSLEQFNAIAKTINKNISIQELNDISKEFSEQYKISLEKSKAIYLTAFVIVKGCSIDNVILTRDRRIKELKMLKVWSEK